MNDKSPKATAATPVETTGDTVSREIEGTGSRPAATRPSGPPPTGDYEPARLPGGPAQHIGEYAVVRKLGEGGMGAVYLAEDAKLGRKVAIKTMKPELAANAADRERFLREARAAASVEHDNIVPIWGVGQAVDGTPFIAMPFLQGEMLDDRLRREPVSAVGLIVKVAREVADGLAAAHAKGLIHRDIKPGNVWLEGDLSAKSLNEQVRRCKILDFGLARSVDKEEAQLTVSGAILGTPAFMAPEQARGEKVDHRADLFSLGATLYRMATGRRPFTGSTAMAVLLALATESPPPVLELAPAFPPSLASLIERLLCKDAAGRPQSATEVAESVRRIAKELVGKSKSSARLTPAAPVLPPLPRVAPKPPPLPKHAGEAPALAKSPVETRPPATTAAKKPRRRFPLAVAVAAGLLTLASLAGLIIFVAARGNNPDAAKTGDPPGAAKPPADPKAQPQPRAEPPKLPEVKKGVPRPAPDRQVAQHVLALKGSVQVNDEENDIEDAGKLPGGALKLTHVSLRESKATDADLKRLGECEHLRSIDLSQTKISDEGLAHLSGLASLEKLFLASTPVGDEGLAHLKSCPELRVLSLSGTKVRGKGLTHLKNLKWLSHLGLSGTPVTASGLANLKGFPLEYVDLSEVAEFTDGSLMQLKELKSLRELHVSTGVTPTDDPAESFVSGLTFKGLLEFKQAMPKCKITTVTSSGPFDRKTVELTEAELLRRVKLKK
jgi:serine/threonine protein kinase